MYLNCKIDSNVQDWQQYENLPVIQIFEDTRIDNISLDGEPLERLDGYTYQKNLVVIEADALFKIAGKLWRQAEDIVLCESSVCSCDIKCTKTQIVSLFVHCYKSILDCKDTPVGVTWQNTFLSLLELFKRCILPLEELDDDCLNKLVSNNISVENEKISLYFHMYLEVRRLMLLIESVLDSPKVEFNIQCIMKDLVALSYKIFQKQKSENILQTQPFPCYCVKKFWWYLNYFCHNIDVRFWKLFVSVVQGKNEEFNLWLLYHIALLQGCNKSGVYIGPSSVGFNENHLFVEQCVQSLIASQSCTNVKILAVLKMLDPLLTNLWMSSAKLEPYQILWEYFYKNLNTSVTDGVRTPKTCREFYEKIRSLVDNNTTTRSGFEYFVSMLCKHFRVHPHQWPKLRGRIYSRLPSQKIKDFNDKAVYQIGLLFLTLAASTVPELIEKLLSLLANLPQEHKHTEFIWIMYITTIIVCICANIDIGTVALPVQEMLQEASKNRDHYYLIKQYVNGLDIIINLTDTFKLSQSMLFGSWIVRYMSSCSLTDLSGLINTLTLMLEKVQGIDNWGDFKTICSSHILPGLKQTAAFPNAPPQIGRLAALICQNVPEAQSQIVQYFCGEHINVKVTYQFMINFLQDNSITQNIPYGQENTLIQGWVKCCLLSNECNSEELTKKIFSLEMVATFPYVADDNVHDPFVAFVGVLRQQMLVQTNSHRLKELCEICFGQVQGWLRSYLTQPTSEPYILNVYTGISLLFYHCAPLLYHKTKSSCLLNRLITALLLPTEVLMGKPPHANILSAIERTWHLFVKGIHSLDYTSDAYIERTLKDLIVRYLPQFSPSNSPIGKVLDDNNLAEFVLEKISNAFLMRSARSLEENTFKAVKTIQHILEVTCDNGVIKLIVQKTLSGMLEVIMFNSQKTAAVDFMKYVSSSEWYVHERGEIRQAIQDVSEKHLAFNANNYFQLIGILIKLIPVDVRACLPQIKNQVSKVERMRGVGFDATLRQGLERIENALSL